MDAFTRGVPNGTAATAHDAVNLVVVPSPADKPDGHRFRAADIEDNIDGILSLGLPLELERDPLARHRRVDYPVLDFLLNPADNQCGHHFYSVQSSRYTLYHLQGTREVENPGVSRVPPGCIRD